MKSLLISGSMQIREDEKKLTFAVRKNNLMFK